MPEPYAVRMLPGGGKEYYMTKADYIAGRKRASNTAYKRYSRIMSMGRR